MKCYVHLCLLLIKISVSSYEKKKKVEKKDKFQEFQKEKNVISFSFVEKASNYKKIFENYIFLFSLHKMKLKGPTR